MFDGQAPGIALRFRACIAAKIKIRNEGFRNTIIGGSVMNNLLKNLLLGGSAAALAVGAAYAQGAAAPADDIETVNSSAGRLNLQGFAQPTPVTVIGIETLNRDAKINIGDEIRELPQIRSGNSIQTGSNTGCVVQVNAGVDTVALRNLGAQRNLVLFDHQRVSPSTIQDGQVDLSLIPSSLVQRVDVVTGGASAAWGSDAVTGVINIVINKTYEGFKGSATYSNSTEVSNPVYKASFAWGTSFLGGKGHIVAAADITHADEDFLVGDSWKSHAPIGRGFVYNPAYCNAITYTGTATTGGTCSSVNVGQPVLVYAFGTGGSVQSTVGGLVQSNSAGTAGSAIGTNTTYLKGTMFVGANADPTKFNYGTMDGANNCYNGCTNNQYGTGGWGNQTNPYHSGNYFMYTSYQILPDLKASVQLNYSRLTERISGNTISGTGRPVYADNPYLPDSIAQAFVCNPNAPVGVATCAGGTSNLSNGYNPFTHQNDLVVNGTALTLAQRQARPSQSFTAGFEYSGNRPNPSPTSDRGVYQNASGKDFTWDNRCQAIYQNCGWANKAVMRGVFTLDGTISDDWSWNAYIQNSDVRIKQNVQQVFQGRVNNALDAVRVTTGNVGTSGLPIGSIQCRGLLNGATAYAPSANSFGITSTGELAGCVPYDPFGDGAASAATLAYVSPGKFNAPNGNGVGTTLVRMQQASGAISLQGVLPWKLPAGDIGVAFGGEWRLERQGQYNTDGYSQSPGGQSIFPSGNYSSNFEGHLHAEEGFLEVDAPILKNEFVQSLDVTMAGRITNYSFSGLVETWKLGATSQVNDDIKLRVTWSYDIRQPDIWDLYAPGANSGNTCPTFVPGGPTNQCFNVNGGNPGLVPEKANTIAAGIVLTPSFLDGVTASVDWYQIHLHGALFTPGQTEPITRCQQGDLNYCSLLIFANQGSFASARGCGTASRDRCPGADTNSQILFVKTAPVNAALLTTAGFDFAVAYNFDLFTGSADVSFNGNYMYDFSRTLSQLFNVGGVNTAIPITFQGAGTTGGFYSGGNNFRGTLNFNYREGAWSFGTQVRIQGDSVMNFGNEGNPLIPLQTVTYSQINGQNVAIQGSGQRYAGYTSTNYNAYAVGVDLRASYKWSNNITLFSAVDNVQDLPTFGSNQRRSYRAGVRWNY